MSFKIILIVIILKIGARTKCKNQYCNNSVKSYLQTFHYHQRFSYNERPPPMVTASPLLKKPTSLEEAQSNKYFICNKLSKRRLNLITQFTLFWSISLKRLIIVIYFHLSPLSWHPNTKDPNLLSNPILAQED